MNNETPTSLLKIYRVEWDCSNPQIQIDGSINNFITTLKNTTAENATHTIELLIAFCNKYESQKHLFFDEKGNFPSDLFHTTPLPQFENKELIALLVENLKKFRNNMELVIAMLRILFILARIDSNLIEIGVTGGIKIIIDILKLYEYNSDIQQYGCAALFNVAFKNDENEMQIGSEGGIARITNAMRNHPKHIGVQKYGCGALGNLAYNCESNQTQIRQEGGIERIIVAMIIHLYGHSDLQLEAAGTLRNLAYNNADNRIEIARSGGIPVLVQVMKIYDKNAELQLQVCAALWNLASSESNLIMIGKAGAIPYIKQALKAYPTKDKLQHYAIGLLWFLSTFQSVISDFGTEIIQEKGIDLILDALIKHPSNDGVQQAAKSSLTELSRYAQVNKYLLKRKISVR